MGTGVASAESTGIKSAAAAPAAWATTETVQAYSSVHRLPYALVPVVAMALSSRRSLPGKRRRSGRGRLLPAPARQFLPLGEP